MCRRAYETYTDKELNARYIRGAPTAYDIHQLILMPEPVYNLCPTMNSPVLRVVDGSRRLDLMHWQLIPRYESLFKTKLTTINAKSETVFTSSVFGELVERQRCIVDKRILRMEARRKDQKALQDSSRRRTDNEPGRRMGHVATAIKT